ncbi:MAG: hypothetical protein C4524_07900 [Candidatus Zixiibacteriota bacterium]|nr:MAG: hypothetical protein C4524_07900 [candidate division Zixibacteria bacterium]
MNHSSRISRPLLSALVCVLLALAWLLASCDSDDSGGTFALPPPQPLVHPADCTLVLVPAGPVVLGNVPEGWGNYQVTPEVVPVDSFYLERYEVSNLRYAAYLAAALDSGLVEYDGQNVYQVSTGKLLLRTAAAESRLQYVDSLDTFVAEAGYENLPVALVSWYGAQAFAEFYGRRLPTEVEWEKAARGTVDLFGKVDGVGVGYPYPWGDQAPNAQLANFDSGLGGLEVVQSYPQGMSWYGAFNMGGNAWEWTATANGSSRVRRGGSYLSSAEMLLTAARFFSDPAITDKAIGFRCAMDP